MLVVIVAGQPGLPAVHPEGILEVVLSGKEVPLGD
jgi:hypothetical protein